uniref:RRM domain-containing protein n=1 Tax=Macrostomum lignano TaxID=282301 RepID=A0A1I8FDY9_9PLAT
AAQKVHNYDSGNHKESHSREDICCRLFIGGLSPSVTSDSLPQVLQPVRTVQALQCARTVPRLRDPRATAFLTYKDPRVWTPPSCTGLTCWMVETKRRDAREEANNPEAHITTKKLLSAPSHKDVTDSCCGLFLRPTAPLSTFAASASSSVFDDYDARGQSDAVQASPAARWRLSQHITDVKKGLTKEELGSAHLREQQQSRGGGITGAAAAAACRPRWAPSGAMMMSACMGPWGPMMGPMMGGGSGPKPRSSSSTESEAPQPASKPSKSPAGAGGGPGPNGMGAPGGSMADPTDHMGNDGHDGTSMGPMGWMGPGPMGPMGNDGTGSMGPMGMMGPGPMGPMGMMGPGFGFYPNQCGGYGPDEGAERLGRIPQLALFNDAASKNRATSTEAEAAADVRLPKYCTILLLYHHRYNDECLPHPNCFIMVFGGASGGSRQSALAPRDPSDEAFRKIFVGGLSPDVSTDGLREYFAKFGEVTDCVGNPATQRSKGFGFVTFKDAETVNAVQAKRPHTIQDKEVEVKRAMPRDEGDRPEFRLFVGSLPKDATEDEIREQFGQFGDIESVEIARVKETGDSRGFGFVTFSDYDSVDKAVLHRPHRVKNCGVDVRKGLSREEMQRVRMRQQQQQQQFQQPYGYPYQQQEAGGTAASLEATAAATAAATGRKSGRGGWRGVPYAGGWQRGGGGGGYRGGRGRGI